MKTDKGKNNSSESNPEKSFEAGRKGGSSPINTSNKSSNEVNNSKPTGQQSERKNNNDAADKRTQNFMD